MLRYDALYDNGNSISPYTEIAPALSNDYNVPNPYQPASSGGSIIYLNSAKKKIANGTGWQTVETLFQVNEDRNLLLLSHHFSYDSISNAHSHSAYLLLKNIEVIPLEYSDADICNNGVTLTPTCENEFTNADIDIDYLWSPSTGLSPTTADVISPFAQPNNTTNYTINVSYYNNFILNSYTDTLFYTDSNGIDTFNVYNFNPINHTDTFNFNMPVNIFVLNNDTTYHTVGICDDFIEICAEHGDTHLWNTSDTSECINISQTGVYTCVSQLNTCTHTNIYNVIDIHPVITIDNITEANCNNGSISISVSGANAYYYNISNSTTSYLGGNNFTFTHLISGTYSITVTDTLTNCSQTIDSIIVSPACGCESFIIQDGDPIAHITSNTIWNLTSQNYVFNTDVVIEAGKTLKIDGRTISFTPGYGIKVNENATLRVENSSVLTNYVNFNCDDLWRGIYDYRGVNYIYVYNSTIKNAVKGIDFYGSDIIITDNSHFINNIYDIKAYRNDLGTIKIMYTEFLSTGSIYGNNNYPIYHIDLEKSSHAIIDNCTFTSQYPIYDPLYPSMLFPIHHRGIGIFTNMASLNKITYNTFNLLEHAVKSTNSTKNVFLENTYDHCYREMLMENCKFDKITFNTFNVWREAPYVSGGTHHLWYYPYGLYMNKCADYTLSDNLFTNIENPAPGRTYPGAYIGAYINASPTVEIYNNTFNHFNKGTLDKSTALIIVGKNNDLQIKCNDFGYKPGGVTGPNTENTYDIALVDKAIIGQQQGQNLPSDIEAPANNRFAHHYNNGSSSWDDKALFRNMYVNNIEYIVYEEETKTDLRHHYSLSVGITPTNAQGVPSFNKQFACPDHNNKKTVTIVPGGGRAVNSNSVINGIDELEAELNSLEQEQSNKLQEFNSLVDNGNTDILLSKVENITEQNYNTVSSEIIETNGFVSDRVIEEFMQKDISHPIAKTIALRDVSPLPQKAKQKISETELNQSLQNYLQIFQNGMSPRELMEKEITAIKNQENKLIFYAVKDVTENDTTGEYINSLISLLENKNSLYAQEQVLYLQMQNKNYNNALAVINNLRNLTSSFEPEKAEYINNWLYVEEIAVNIATADSLQKDSIVLANTDFLTNLATDNNQKAQIMAQLMLENADIAQFDEYTPLPGINELEDKSMAVNSNNNIINNKEDLLYIYPNPVKDILTVEYALLTSTNINSISIYDIKGKLLISIPVKEQIGIEKINVSSLNKGNYIISFGNKGINKFSKKFIVK